MKKNFNYKLLAAGASVFLMSASMLYLQGCGSDNDSSTVTTTTANSATTTTVGTATTTTVSGNTGGGGVSTTTNVFLDSIIGDLDYYYIHGSTSTDRSKFLVTFNEMPIAGGTTHLYMLDADSVANATPTLASSGTTYGTVTGDSSGPLDATITFRSTWTQDDSKIMLSGADRFYVINANTLA
ncbi:MAG: hypothetical protein KJ950_04830, partial [Proteobacteria bacterium]|nr:hypothetical protein [Pseudomonadota bacterium]MBU1686865.1 hypothetical protein [Pseudomonadota bacterium]